jgi:hypothetical protein
MNMLCRIHTIVGVATVSVVASSKHVIGIVIALRLIPVL